MNKITKTLLLLGAALIALEFAFLFGGFGRSRTGVIGFFVVGMGMGRLTKE